ncbi:MAG TPA: energy-coupling factor transporter ATPase [Ktedonobacteraceae bacterium]|jgi:energy-coupling factor transport system ATP-binding protein|nr:energy-coupling factor transporter ATPase [Ktedonobacteraceae bacterium]
MQRYESDVPLISFQHVAYAYPASQAGQESVPVLRGVDLHIGQGEYVILLGHNGSGKSTLARHCNALLLPDSGDVLVGGQNTRDVRALREIREQVGMIFQNPDSQIIATIVEDDVAWSLIMRGLPAKQVRVRVEEMMEAVGITHLRKLPPHKLSGGQRQRVAIAGVLALRPRCIIADEATSMLDPLSRQEINQLLHQLHEVYGLTIIQVTHLLEEAALAQRVIVMEQGRVLLDDTPTKIFADLPRLRALNLLIPEPLELAERLRAAGMPLDPEAITLESIARALNS